MKVFLLALLLSSCAHHAASPAGSVEHVVGRAPTDAPAEYRDGVDALEAGKYDVALRSFDHFMQQNPANRYYQAALLNSGRALEGMRSWNDAAIRYHQVVEGTAKAPRLRAMALYRLSYVHEALGDDPKVVADLNDLLSRTRDLPVELAEGEMPARLAAAYARVGNFERAQDFYRRAEAGIARLRANGTPDWLPRTMYLMGTISRENLSWNDFETFLRPLARSQVYLLQSAELAVAPWSDRAADELIGTYNDLFSVVAAPPGGDDSIVARRSLQQRQWQRAGLLIEALSDLRARMLPDADSAAISRLRSGLNEVNLKVARLLEERPAGEGLTPSAIARRRARLLKTEATNDSLEQAFLKSSRPAESAAPGSAHVDQGSAEPAASGAEPIHVAPAAPAAPAPPAPAATPAAHSGDPNL